MIPYIDKMAVKIGLVLAILTLLTGFVTWGYNSIFEAGVNHQIAKEAKEYEEREKELTKKLNAAIAANEVETDKAILLQGKLTKSQNDARILRDKINDAVFDCVAIGGSFGELWNESSRKPTE